MKAKKSAKRKSRTIRIYYIDSAQGYKYIEKTPKCVTDLSVLLPH